MATSNSFENPRLSAGSTGWAHLSDFASNLRQIDGALLDEQELDPQDVGIDDDDNLNAFGVTTPSKSNVEIEEFECEEDDDGAAAFGGFDSD